MTDDAKKDEKEILNLSDEEFANLSEPAIPEEDNSTLNEEQNVEEEEQEESSPSEDSTATDNIEEDADKSSDNVEESSKKELSDSESKEQENNSESEFFSKEEKEESSEEKENSTEKEEITEPTEEELKAVYDTIFKPFKANGREMQVNNVDEVIQLMQMGANYNKKMGAIKEKIPYIKMLENNGLLDEEQLSFLIDLKEKKPEAIAKLLQDSDINLYDFDTEELSTEYKPTNRAVSKQEIEVEEVLSEIKESPQYARTVTTLGTEWDEASRNRIVNQPQLIKIINEHMESGIYDTITKEIERLRVLGQLNGVSDFDAYDKIGAMLFSTPQNTGQTQQNQQPELSNNPYQQQIAQQELAKKKQEEIQKKKKAASSTVKKSPQSSVSAIDILNLSDEEFEKLGNPKFI